MTTSGKVASAAWGFLGLVVTATALPVAIATSRTEAWVALAVGLVVVGLAVLSLVKGWAIFGDGSGGIFGYPWDRSSGT